MQNSEQELAVQLVRACQERGVTLATAESCTGGLVAAAITAVSGASTIFLGGVVSYANAAKSDLLGVDPELIAREGAVSVACAQAMAQGVRTRLGADLSVALTGIAGPGGGTEQKPVGLVYLGFADKREVRSEGFHFSGDRGAVRQQAVIKALTRLLEAIQQR